MKYPIAIVDYGIGGLGLYNLIRKDFPKLPLLYFSDSGKTPYGKLPKAVLRSRLEAVFKFLKQKGAEHIVVACHSASSVVLDSDENVTGLRPQTIRAVKKSKPKVVGIIGGGRTIRSGYYRRELNKAGIKTVQRVAQPLSILVERGETDTANVHKAVAEIISPLRSCDSILLACTHYPVLGNVIRKYSTARLIDPVEELYKSIKPLLSSKIEGNSSFLTTGNKQLMIKAGEKAFHVRVVNPTRVTF